MNDPYFVKTPNRTKDNLNTMMRESIFILFLFFKLVKIVHPSFKKVEANDDLSSMLNHIKKKVTVSKSNEKTAHSSLNSLNGLMQKNDSNSILQNRFGKKYSDMIKDFDTNAPKGEKEYAKVKHQNNCSPAINDIKSRISNGTSNNANKSYTLYSNINLVNFNENSKNNNKIFESNLFKLNNSNNKLDNDNFYNMNLNHSRSKQNKTIFTNGDDSFYKSNKMDHSETSSKYKIHKMKSNLLNFLNNDDKTQKNDKFICLKSYSRNRTTASYPKREISFNNKTIF